MNFSAVILAGGKSSRMGRDKAWLEISGKTLLARQIELIQCVGAKEVFISGRVGVDYSTYSGQVLVDRFQNAGPLAGIERGLAVMSTTLLLVLAVDMSAMNADCLTKLRAICAETSGAIPQLDGRIEPLAAFYPKSALNLAVELLQKAQGQSGLRGPGPTDFARSCVKENLAKFAPVTVSEAPYFTNLNSPEDLQVRNDSVL